MARIVACAVRLWHHARGPLVVPVVGDHVDHVAHTFDRLTRRVASSGRRVVELGELTGTLGRSRQPCAPQACALGVPRTADIYFVLSDA